MQEVRDNIVSILTNVLNLIDEETQYDDVIEHMEAVEQLVEEHNELLPADFLKAYRALEVEMYCAKGAMYEVIAYIERVLETLDVL